MGFFRQEYSSGLLIPSLEALPDPGIETVSPASLALQVDSLLLSHWGSPLSLQGSSDILIRYLTFLQALLPHLIIYQNV